MMSSASKSPENPTAHCPPRHQASELMDGGTLARIEHEGQLYTLRITRARKLILTK